MLGSGVVESVSLTYETPVKIRGTYGISSLTDPSQDKSVIALPADEDFIGTMEIALAAGENLSRADIEAESEGQSPEEGSCP